MKLYLNIIHAHMITHETHAWTCEQLLYLYLYLYLLESFSICEPSLSKWGSPLHLKSMCNIVQESCKHPEFFFNIKSLLKWHSSNVTLQGKPVRSIQNTSNLQKLESFDFLPPNRSYLEYFRCCPVEITSWSHLAFDHPARSNSPWHPGLTLLAAGLVLLCFLALWAIKMAHHVDSCG